MADLPAATARFDTSDAQSQGHWKARYGARGTWIPGVGGDTSQDGHRLEVLSGTSFHWPAPTSADPRVLEHPQESVAQPTCWFANDDLILRVVPPDTQLYRLTLYVLDYDRNGRALKITLDDEFASLSTADVSATDAAGGVYLTWTASGTVNVALKKMAGYNVVLSGVFVDPANEK